MRGRLPLLLAMAALLLIAVVASRGQSAVHPGEQSLLPVHNNAGATAPAPDEQRPNDLVSTIAAIGLTGIFLIFTALFLFGLAVIIMGMARSRARRAKLANPIQLGDTEDGEAPSDGGGTLLRVAVAAAREELAARREGPPADAVIAAWLKLEEAAAASGVAKKPHQTSTEFTTTLLAEHLGAQGAVDRLRSLYQRARFARTGSITPQDADTAHTALTAILDGWGVRT